MVVLRLNAVKDKYHKMEYAVKDKYKMKYAVKGKHHKMKYAVKREN